jgi:trk system potassium uptake protein TrkA
MLIVLDVCLPVLEAQRWWLMALMKADAFVAVTQGDNRNVMGAQIAKNIFNVPRVICRIYDPLRKDVYEALGLEAVSPTTVFAQLLRDKLLAE